MSLIISTGCKIYALYTKFLKCVAFHKDWVWLDTERDVNVSACASVSYDLVTCGIFNVGELCDSSEGQHQWGGSGARRM